MAATNDYFNLWLELKLFYTILWIIISFLIYKMSENEIKLMAAIWLFCPTNSPQDSIWYSMILNWEKQEILTFWKLEPANVWYFPIINDLND